MNCTRLVSRHSSIPQHLTQHGITGEKLHWSYGGHRHQSLTERMLRTKMDNTTTARQPSEEVFATYELLENILARLPSPIDLGKVQQVCRHFYSVTKRSKLLRQRLFLEPEPGNKREINKNINSKLNPVPRCVAFLPWAFFHHRCALKLEYCNFKRLLRWQQGQWERMFISQPPIKKLIVHGGRLDYSLKIEDSEGIRLDTLVQRLREWEGKESERLIERLASCSDCLRLSQ